MVSLDKRRQHERNKYLALYGRKEGMHVITKDKDGQPQPLSAYAKCNASRLQVRWLTQVLDRWKLPIKSAVDFGCGRNGWCVALRERGIAATGVDFACPLADVDAPMHYTGLPSESADIVTAWDALEHCLPDDVPLVLAEMRRVVKHGGLFLAHIPTGASRVEVDGENLHATQRPIAWWRDRLREAGFKGIREKENDFWGRAG